MTPFCHSRERGNPGKSITSGLPRSREWQPWRLFTRPSNFKCFIVCTLVSKILIIQWNWKTLIPLNSFYMNPAFWDSQIQNPMRSNLAFSGLRRWGSRPGFNSILSEGLIHLIAPLFPWHYRRHSLKLFAKKISMLTYWWGIKEPEHLYM